jgi:hypothetical protein
MTHPDVAKPATVSSEPALNVEQLGGPLNQSNTKTPSRYQALFEVEHLFGRKFVVEHKRRRVPSRRSA